MLKHGAFTQAFANSKADARPRHEDGQTMAEYGVVLAVITPAIIAAISLLSGNVRDALANVASILPG